MKAIVAPRTSHDPRAPTTSTARLVARGFLWGLPVGLAIALAIGAAWWSSLLRSLGPGDSVSLAHEPADRAALAGANTLLLPERTVDVLQISASRVRPAPRPAPMRLDGSLFVDPNNLAHVHTRFAGEVVKVGPALRAEDYKSAQRTLRFGDEVQKDDLLAVVWSKELGEKKSELLDALSRLTLDRETRSRLAELYKKGAVPERSLREIERDVESDLIAVARAERTLESWRVSREEIALIRDEAVRIHRADATMIARDNQPPGALPATIPTTADGTAADPEEQARKENWARVEVRAAFDGVVVEKNISEGDVVDTELNLFKIANLSRLNVVAHAYEEHVEQLEHLSRDQRHWNIFLKSNPHDDPVPGSFAQIGNIIDPNQHTALVMGWVDNRDGRLRVGQFITAVVDLPARENEVAVPLSALVEKDGASYVFVQPKRDEFRYVRMQVLPVGRFNGLVYIRNALSEEQRKSGLSSLEVDRWVVNSSALELAAELDSLTAQAELVRTP